MARSLNFNASWLYQESAGTEASTSTGIGLGGSGIAAMPSPPVAPMPIPTPEAPASTPTAPVASDVAMLAEQEVVTELLQIARTVLTLEITFEAGPQRTAEPATPGAAARFDRQVVLRDGQVYGTLCCVSDDRRTPVGSRPADALRCVAVLVGKELDRHRRGLA